MSDYRLHYKGNLIGRVEFPARPGAWADGYGLPLVVSSVSYDPDADRTTVHLDVWNPDKVPAEVSP